jgi:signal transduction histidine kinase
MDLLALVRQCVDEAQAGTDHHSIEISTDLETIDGCWDRERIGRVLWSLLTNAIKSSPGGGRITVRISATGESVDVDVADESISCPCCFPDCHGAPAVCNVASRGVGWGCPSPR